MPSKLVSYVRHGINWSRLIDVRLNIDDEYQAVTIRWDDPGNDGEVELTYKGDTWSVSGDCPDRNFLMSIFASIADECYGVVTEDDEDDEDEDSADDEDE